MRAYCHLDEVRALIPSSYYSDAGGGRVPRRAVPHQRFTVWLGIGLSGLVLTFGVAQNTDPLAARTKGAPHAPVTVYEMADFQCPACRLFAVTVLPTLEREYVQTGKVRWVFINLPLTSIHPNAMAAAEVAMCAARQGRFWPTHDALYQQQDEWAKLAQPRALLVTLAQRAGVDRAKLLACIDDGSTRAEIEMDAQRAVRSGARATPSFYIEGGLLEGAPYTPDPMRRLLDSVYAVRTHAPPSR
jgi:protein-disulfide isomerase